MKTMNPLTSRPPSPSPETDNHLRVCLLASGSKGNSIYISNGKDTILIDAGLSGIEIERRMRARGLSPESIDALLVSHEHHDHIHGVGVLSRRFHFPGYLNPKKFKKAASRLGKLTAVSSFECGCTFQIGSLTIHPFSTSHDAEDSAGFTIQHNTHKIGMATDLGIATTMVKEHLKQCDLLILEANHDIQLLENGPYPWPLKQRVKSRVGHLSNETSKQLLMDVKHDGLSHVILAHLSQQNNTPWHALREVGLALHQSRAKLILADQTHGSEMLCLK
jgi:phosphoribosyl 1,2-cyclic phosphodiesterase